MCEPPTLAFGWSGGFLFQNQIFEWTAKSRKRWFSSFLWSLSNVKIIEYLTKTSYARLYALWLGSWASTTTLAVKPLAVDTFFMLVGMVYAVSSHFVDVFYKFLFHLLFVFFENNFQYCNGITCFFSWWLYFITKNCSRFRKIEKKQNLF